MPWAMFTKRTNPPKLTWLRRHLDMAGIPNRLSGESFHAPILQVPEEDLDAAWKILTPVDDIPDDDEQFNEGLRRVPGCPQRCWTKGALHVCKLGQPGYFCPRCWRRLET